MNNLLKLLVLGAVFAAVSSVEVRPHAAGSEQHEKTVREGDAVRDESVDNYITMVLENFAIAMRTGIPILGIPILDPFNISKLDLPTINTSMLRLEANASDLSVSDTSSYVPTYVHVDFETNAMYLNLHFLDIRVDGDYWCDGMAAVIFPVFGDGFFYINIMSIDSSGLGAVIITEDDHLQITELSLELAYDRLEIYFDNFLGGGDFGEEVNQAISVLADTIVQEILPLLNTAIIPALVVYINDALMQITISDIIGGGSV
ncbi:uncharacterized protein LOC108682872 [Hyalella azteca]|uniref:Uncharacterized protein LOC108682872 n=1 Tax=Hyalella azteca TaxID=294128 RepID=A0A8B7PQS0_HYAAZ|nr:uncharacterized protein LOC108682872 [Hyalella azteca]